MASAPTESEVLDAARPLIKAGMAVHWLRSQSKAPADEKWNDVEPHDFASLTAAYRRGANLGIRLGEPSLTEAGYVQLVDLDIREPGMITQARAALREMWPDFESFPSVRSGSGGASRHYYFVTPVAFASRKLAHSEGFALVFDARKGRDVKKWDWEIELYGTRKQAVLPPSIHPDTGLPYVWDRPFNLAALAMGVGPTVSTAMLEEWGAWKDQVRADEDDLMSVVRAQPMGLEYGEIHDTIYSLPRGDWCDDRDGWLQVGMALHHEFEGGDEGLKLWNEWSSQSEKYDSRDQARVWKSFGETRGQPVRMATLIKAAGLARLEEEQGGIIEGTAVVVRSIDDMLGGPDESASSKTTDLMRELCGDPPVPNLDPLLDPEWRSRLHITEEGEIKATLHNLELIVGNDPRTRGMMAFNEFIQEVVQRSEPGAFRLQKPGPKPTKQLEGKIWAVKNAYSGDMWSDAKDNALRAMLEAPKRQGGYQIKVSDRDLAASVDIAARRRSFHPVCEYLSDLKWDGVKRLETLFIDYLHAPDDDYHRECAVLTLVGAVTRVFEPGHKFDFVPIFEGAQGKRKTTFIEILGRGWYVEMEGDFHDRKSMVEKMQGAWICELGELQGFTRSDVTVIKGFISARFDKVRMAYARRAETYPRQCIFIGSTNNRQYLRDETGGRRFWPVETRLPDGVEIDTDRAEREVNQIWAEAKAVYDEMRRVQPFGTLPLYLRSEQSRLIAAELQESRRIETIEDMMSGQVVAWADKPYHAEGSTGFDEDTPTTVRNQLCAYDIWCDMLGRDMASLTPAMSQQIGRTLRDLPGWYSASRRYTEKYGQQRVVRRSGAAFLS